MTGPWFVFVIIPLDLWPYVSGEEKSRAANPLVVGKVAGQASSIQIYSEIAFGMTSTGPSLQRSLMSTPNRAGLIKSQTSALGFHGKVMSGLWTDDSTHQSNFRSRRKNAVGNLGSIARCGPSSAVVSALFVFPSVNQTHLRPLGISQLCRG